MVNVVKGQMCNVGFYESATFKSVTLGQVSHVYIMGDNIKLISEFENYILYFT